MAPNVAEERPAPRILVAFFHLFQPILKPILKRTLRRNKWVWRRVQAVRDRVVQAEPPSVGLQAPFSRRLYPSLFYVVGPAAKVLLTGTVGRNGWAWRRLKAAHYRLLRGPRPGPLPAVGAGDVRSRNGLLGPFGVNAAGYFKAATGTGEAARSAVRLLRAAAIPCVLNNVIGPGSTFEDADREFTDENPYAINLIYVNPDQAANFAWDKGEVYFRGHYNIGVWNWELPDFPREWLQRFRYYDEIWVASDFVAGALSRVSPVPILKMPYAIDPQPARRHNVELSHFGLSTDGFLFLFVFDFHSIFERKNPLGLIEAFRRAFGGDRDAALVIKSSHADDGALRKMRDAAQGANVKIVNAPLSREKMNALYSLCDCYVSLHRSEGFGLTPAEAMCMAKPVIATAYGGNTDFMTSDNSYLVKYQLVEIDRDYGPYRRGWLWAEPDLDHAARLMRHVYENRREARSVGRKARQDIVRLLHPNIVGDLVKQRLLAIASLQGIAVLSLDVAADRPDVPRPRQATRPH